MIYLDNAATSFPKAPGVGEAMARFVNESAANPGRAGHRLAVAAERMLDDARLKLTRFFEGDDPHRMVFTMNTTDSLNMAIKGVLEPNGQSVKPHVITTVLEHNSVSRPLQALADAGRIELLRIDCDNLGFVDPSDIARSIKASTKLIVMTHASNVLGTIQDATAVGRIAREHNVLFLLDAAQSAGVVPVSIKAMNIDLLAFPGHKSLLGPTGTGGLYVGERCPQPGKGLHPWREGGTGGDSSTPTQPLLYPYYLEGGTPNTIGVAGLSAAMDYLAQSTLADRLSHEQKLVQLIIDGLSTDERFTIYGPNDAKRRVGAVAVNIRGYEPSDAGSILDDSFEIAVRPGLHCSPYAHKKLGTFPSGAIRISPGPFNSVDDVMELIGALKQIAG